MTRVWSSEEPTEANERLLLLAIADAANEEGICWPSVKALARKCGVQPHTARKNLARLVEQGFIERVERPGRSNVYRLRIPAPEDTRSPTPPGIIIEPSLNPQHNHQRPGPWPRCCPPATGVMLLLMREMKKGMC